jgi:DNA replication protein DnaC
VSKSLETLEYFKTLPSSLYSFGIPHIHSDSHLYNFNNPYTDDNNDFWIKLKDTTEKFMTLDIKQCPRYLFLCGCPGSGKTKYAVSLYRAMLQKRGLGSGGGGVFFTSFINMAMEIILGFKDDMPLRVSLEGYLEDQWLFLDDFTSSERIFKKDSMEYQLFRDIIINRWDSGKTLITSSNLESDILMKKLDEMFGDYLVSRLSDSVVIQFPDDDLRKIKK